MATQPMNKDGLQKNLRRPRLTTVLKPSGAAVIARSRDSISTPARGASECLRVSTVGVRDRTGLWTTVSSPPSSKARLGN